MVEIRIKFDFSSMVPETKNKLIAPRLSELVAPKLPDISRNRKYLLNAFILNFDLSLVLPNVLRQLYFNFIRKT